MTTCTRDGWNIATETRYYPTKQITLSAFHGFTPSGKPRYGEYHGRQFTTTDDAWRFAEAYGYLAKYCRRPNAFIDARLTPRCRQHVRNMPDEEVLRFIARLAGDRKYIRCVLTADYMADTRNRWIDQARR